MKTIKYLLPVLLFLFSSCGYHNPNVYNGPTKIIYITNWKNKTSQMNLDMDIYRELVKWFQKSEAITVTKDREEADLILAGEITSIDLPSLAYGSDNSAKEVKLHLDVRYIMKDLESGTVIMEVPGERYTEELLVGLNSAEYKDNEQKALDSIIEDLAQKIYRKAIKKMPKL